MASRWEGEVVGGDRGLEICSFSGWELYARVDPVGQIAATNFKKNMSSPCNSAAHPLAESTPELPLYPPSGLRVRRAPVADEKNI